VGSVKSRLQNVKTQYQYVIVRYQHQSFWNEGLFSSTAEVSVFLEYQLHVERIVLYFLQHHVDILKFEL